jgi:hypothetical protein
MIFGIKGNPIGVIFGRRVSTFRRKVCYPPSGWKIRRVGKICFLQTQEMGDRLRLWEDQCEPLALKRTEAREKVSIHAREERGPKGIKEIKYIDER